MQLWDTPRLLLLSTSGGAQAGSGDLSDASRLRASVS